MHYEARGSYVDDGYVYGGHDLWDMRYTVGTFSYVPGRKRVERATYSFESQGQRFVVDTVLDLLSSPTSCTRRLLNDLVGHGSTGNFQASFRLLVFGNERAVTSRPHTQHSIFWLHVENSLGERNHLSANTVSVANDALTMRGNRLAAAADCT